MRTISIDTETTGGSPKQGNRAVEIGLVEMIDDRRTGKCWSTYLSPRGKRVQWGALKVHGLSNTFLRDKPHFEDKAEEILAFIDGAPCKAHNARFDRDFLINEFHVCGLPLPKLQFFDTITMAKSLLQGRSFKLDSLVARLDICAPKRDLHGALLDAEILAMVVEKLEEMHPGLLARELGTGRGIDLLPKLLKHLGSEGAGIEQAIPAEAPRGQADHELIQLNPGVAEMLEELNATTGEITDDMSNRVCSGGPDHWAQTHIRQATRVAASMHGKDAVSRAVLGLGKREKKAGIRWMCRGMEPDRLMAYSRSLSRMLWEKKRYRLSRTKAV